MEFDKPWTWDEAALQNLIDNEAPESLYLDYKACAALGKTDAKRTELTRDVSAFANAGGGTLVYGVLEANSAAVGFDVGFDPTDISRDWIEQVVASGIQRRIEAVRVHEIPLPSVAVGRVAHVIHVPQSSRAPHMAADHRYWKRLGTTKAMMEEYEVRDVSRRTAIPDLRLALEVDSGLVFEGTPAVARLSIRSVMTNGSAEPADIIVAEVIVDKRLSVLSRGSYHLQPGEISGSVGVQTAPMQRYMHAWGPNNIPVWAGLPVALEAMTVAVPAAEAEYLLITKVRAPHMTEQLTGYTLRVNGTAATLLPEVPSTL